MRAPKILPWVARKAGISDELALKLWRRAAGEAETLAGSHDGSDFFRLAVERFIDLVEAESSACIDPESLARQPVSWMWRHQKRMGQLNVLAAQNAYRAWKSNWDNLLSQHRHAA